MGDIREGRPLNKRLTILAIDDALGVPAKRCNIVPMKQIFLLLSLLLCVCFARAQSVPAAFVLAGGINADTGAILLTPVGDDTAYYPTYPNPSEVPVSKGRFSFTGTLPYPYAFRLSFRRGMVLQYVSDVFLVGPGPQTINCHLGTVHEIPYINNTGMRELRLDYLRSAGPVTVSLDSLQEVRRSLRRTYRGHVPDSATSRLDTVKTDLFNKKDEILLSYVKTHPNSYVALWELVAELSTGYRGRMNDIFGQLSEAVRQSYTGKELAKRLDHK